MMQNYSKKITYSNYNGKSWNMISGFAKCSYSYLYYYVFDTRVCAKYDKDWNFLTAVKLKSGTFTGKCINDKLYVTSCNFFYTTNTDLAITNQSSYFPVQFKNIYYDGRNFFT